MGEEDPLSDIEQIEYTPSSRLKPPEWWKKRTKTEEVKEKVQKHLGRESTAYKTAKAIGEGGKKVVRKTAETGKQVLDKAFPKNKGKSKKKFNLMGMMFGEGSFGSGGKGKKGKGMFSGDMFGGGAFKQSGKGMGFGGGEFFKSAGKDFGGSGKFGFGGFNNASNPFGLKKRVRKKRKRKR